MKFDDNDCPRCGGSGAEESGVEYYGQHEMVGCESCCGTGFDDIYLGVDRLRTEISESNESRDAVARQNLSLMETVRDLRMVFLLVLAVNGGGRA